MATMRRFLEHLPASIRSPTIAFYGTDQMRTHDHSQILGLSISLRFTIVCDSPPLPTMPASQKQKETERQSEIIDATGDSDGSDNNTDSEGELDHDAEGQPAGAEDGGPSSSNAQKKKKKKKSKAKKLLNMLRGNQEIPQEVVDTVLDKVKADGGAGAADVNAEHVREALEQLKIMDVVQGKAGLGGLNKKDMGEHKVCRHPCYMDSQADSKARSSGQHNPSHN